MHTWRIRHPPVRCVDTSRNVLTRTLDPEPGNIVEMRATVPGTLAQNQTNLKYNMVSVFPIEYQPAGPYVWLTNEKYTLISSLSDHVDTLIFENILKNNENKHDMISGPLRNRSEPFRTASDQAHKDPFIYSSEPFRTVLRYI